MLKSSSNLLLLGALLSGCTALETPLPSNASGAEIRVALTGFVRTKSVPHIILSRPLDADADAEMGEQWEWIDQTSSRFVLEGEGYGDTLLVDSLPRLSVQYWLRDSLTWIYNGISLKRAWRLHGRLRWNAAIPMATATALWTVDSFDFRADSSEVLHMRRDTLVGELPLRWPQLAHSSTAQRQNWASHPKLLASLVSEWDSLCRIRKTDSVILWGSRSSEVPRPLDTTALRLLLIDSATASIYLAAGDTIYPPLGRTATLWAALKTPAIMPILRWAGSGQRWPFFLPTDTVAWTSAHDAPLSQVPFHIGTNEAVPCGLTWTTIQLAGTCAAFRDWQRVNATTRDQTPVGNVAPFDGYFCTQTLDTISFPEGDALTCHRID